MVFNATSVNNISVISWIVLRLIVKPIVPMNINVFEVKFVSKLCIAISRLLHACSDFRIIYDVSKDHMTYDL